MLFSPYYAENYAGIIDTSLYACIIHHHLGAVPLDIHSTNGMKFPATTIFLLYTFTCMQLELDSL